MKSQKKKSLVLFTLLALIILNFTPFLDDVGEARIGSSFTRAITTFAVARAFNGAISAAQATEISLHPAGLGVTVSPAELLDPVNDLIERFSMVMLISSSSLGGQKLLLKITSSNLAKVLVFVVLLVSALLIWKGTESSLWLEISLIVIFLRFFIPVTAVASNFIFDQFLSSSYNTAIQKVDEAKVAVDKTREEIQNPPKTNAQPTPGSTQSWWDYIQGKIDGLVDTFREIYSGVVSMAEYPEKKWNEYKSIADNSVEYVVNLIAIFVLETILLPLFVLWFGVWGVKRAKRRLLEA